MKKCILLFLGLIGFARIMHGMEEDLKKLKVGETVKIELKNEAVSEISKNEFEAFTAIVDKDIRSMLGEGAPYALPSVNKAGFEGIIKNVDLIKNGDSEKIKEMLIKIGKEPKDLVSVINAAHYLGIMAIMDVVVKSLKEDIFDLISEKSNLLVALLQPGLKILYGLYKIDFERVHPPIKIKGGVRYGGKVGITPLMWAASDGNKEIAQALLKMGVDPNKASKFGSTALHIASRDNYEVAQILIDAGADVNKLAADGKSPLHWAASNGNVKAVELLVEGGAKINQINQSGETALLMAVVGKHADTVKILIDFKADPNISHNRGRLPLLLASRLGHKDIVEMLIKAGAKVNEQGKSFGDTALMDAAGNGHKDIVEMLIDAGADTCYINYRGYTALDFARRSKHQEVVELLEEHSRICIVM